MGKLRLGERVRDYPKVTQNIQEPESCSFYTTLRLLKFHSLEHICRAKYPGTKQVDESPQDERREVLR